jgi:uncharacterized protein YlzI (FlbEa/FlbD family)
MRSNQFIKLHYINNNEVYLNSMLITKIYNSGRGTIILTMSNDEHTVIESVQEIFKLIDNANTITFKNHSE